MLSSAEEATAARGGSQTPDQPRAEFQGTEAARCSGHRGSLCSSMASPKRLQGLTAATITPMTPDGLDHVIIHVGALNLPEAKEMAKHAAVIGASGIAAIAPFFFKPTNKDTLVAFLREIASEAPGIPFYYYHIPSLTGVKIRVEELLDGIKEQIPTFQGVKFSDTDLLDFAQCVKNNKERFVLLYGVDEHLLSALAMGASGAVGSTYNYLGKKYNLMLEAFAKQDLVLAQQHQFCTGEFLSFVFKLGFGVAQTKAVMSFTSRIPMGPPRLPLLSASMDFIEKAKAKMDSLME
ncbi:N-acetylneuraminate lyase isoform X2 [Gopherus evgoodei]|uniref:N-acetylneuraminate lyase isoform X2 n=1 Tax=Gopherus evgoodei TaxID=1825980 RepID=UPI0011CF2213|nr:N-acetylneuraminate lyase isoform X2 [Gopherus evgoodei]